MNKLIIALLITFTAPSLVLAGGGQTKNKGDLRFRNTSNSNAVYILVNAPFEDLLDDDLSLSEFQSLGGRVLGPGESTTFDDLNSGNHRYVYASVNPGSTPLVDDFEDNGIRDANVRGGRTTTINLN